jgi:hypothetical protein
MVKTEMTSQLKWRRQDGVLNWQHQDGGLRMWVKPEVNASAVGDEMTRNRVRGSHLARVNRLGCAPGQPYAIVGSHDSTCPAWHKTLRLQIYCSQV